MAVQLDLQTTDDDSIEVNGSFHETSAEWCVAEDRERSRMVGFETGQSLIPTGVLIPRVGIVILLRYLAGVNGVERIRLFVRSLTPLPHVSAYSNNPPCMRSRRKSHLPTVTFVGKAGP